jgi:WD40-like Beta Propeller Repeat
MSFLPSFRPVTVAFGLACMCAGCGASFAASAETVDATSDAPARGDATGETSDRSPNTPETGAAGTKVTDAASSSDGFRDSGSEAPARDAANEDAALTVADATGSCSATSSFGGPMLVHGGVNSADDDFAPRLSPDELNIYFARRPADNLMAPSHIYVATRPTVASPFDAAIALAINSAASDADPMIADDGLTLFFSSDRPNGSGEFDLYWAHRASTSVPFTTASLVPTVNSPGSELQPFLASDGDLWFAYRKPGMDNALHLRRAPRAGTGFDPPVAVAELDSPTDDTWPLLATDGLTIYFSSLRVSAVMQGKANVWASHRSSRTATFDAPGSVIEVNSPATDLAGWISPDNCRLYLASNRSTGRGYEIYVAER